MPPLCHPPERLQCQYRVIILYRLCDSARFVSAHVVAKRDIPIHCRTVTTTLTAQATSFSTTTSTTIETATTTSTISQTESMSTTYTPVITFTSTLTFTSGPPVTVNLYTPTVANPLAKREIEERAASSIPAYASPCTAYTEYVAACSVAGVYEIAKVSSTLPATTVYVTESVTSTSLSVISSVSSTTETIPTSVASTKVRLQPLQLKQPP